MDKNEKLKEHLKIICHDKYHFNQSLYHKFIKDSFYCNSSFSRLPNTKEEKSEMSTISKVIIFQI